MIMHEFETSEPYAGAAAQQLAAGGAAAVTAAVELAAVGPNFEAYRHAHCLRSCWPQRDQCAAPGSSVCHRIQVGWSAQPGCLLQRAAAAAAAVATANSQAAFGALPVAPGTVLVGIRSTLGRARCTNRSRPAL